MEKVYRNFKRLNIENILFHCWYFIGISLVCELYRI
jgi:hypothetical protein